MSGICLRFTVTLSGIFTDRFELLHNFKITASAFVKTNFVQVFFQASLTIRKDDQITFVTDVALLAKLKRNY